MAEQDYFGRMKRPTLLQITYVEELQKHPGERGMITKVAKSCGVNHTSVSRFYKACQGCGYLTEGYELTEDGRKWLDFYISLREGLRQYFYRLQMEENEVQENMELIFSGMRLQSMQKMIGKKEVETRNVTAPIEDIGSVIRKGEFDLDFRVLRAQADRNGKRALSMADRGFLHPAKVKKNNRGTYVELTIVELQAKSQITGLKMSGRLSAFKYLLHNYDFEVRIRGNKVLIPIEVFEFRQGKLGDMVGVLPVKLRCNVGQLHMPESRALLAIWM